MPTTDPDLSEPPLPTAPDALTALVESTFLADRHRDTSRRLAAQWLAGERPMQAFRQMSANGTYESHATDESTLDVLTAMVLSSLHTAYLNDTEKARLNQIARMTGYSNAGQMFGTLADALGHSSPTRCIRCERGLRHHAEVCGDCRDQIVYERERQQRR